MKNDGSSHESALPLPLSQPAVSETHAKASGMWGNLLRRRITKLSIFVGPDAQRTRDNRSNQHDPNQYLEITGPSEIHDPVEYSGLRTLAVPPHGRLKGLVAPQPGCGQSEGRESHDGANHHRQGAPAGHHRKCITQQWIGLTPSTRSGVLCLDTDRGNAGVAGAMPSDVSHAPGWSGVMPMPSRRSIPTDAEQVRYLYHT